MASKGSRVAAELVDAGARAGIADAVEVYCDGGASEHAGVLGAVTSDAVDIEAELVDEGRAACAVGGRAILVVESEVDMPNVGGDAIGEGAITIVSVL